MMDEDYAYERQRQRRLDRVYKEIDALQELRREVVQMSHREGTCLQHGFLCMALDSMYRKLSVRQYDFLRRKIRNALNGITVLPIVMEDDLYHQYLGNEVMFAAMSHAYRLGIIDQWIANQKEKENGRS